MAGIAFWLQTGDVSAEYVKWLTIFVWLTTFCFLVMAASLGFIALKVVALLTDLKKTFDDTKGKAMPIIAKVDGITHTVQGIIADLQPKIKVVSENVVETSHTVRQTTAKLDVTIRQAVDKANVTFEDANARTQKQVARVDGMIASTLAATAEIGSTVNEGIRAPARKIAAMVTQSKHAIDTLIDRAKALGIQVGSTVDAKVHPKKQKPKGW